MDVEKLLFLDKENMTSVYELEEIRDLSEKAYDHFMHYGEEVLYILHEGKMLGVCSIGDLERFYREDRDELKINRKYTYLKGIDYYNAAAFFERVATVNEIPVLTEDNELLGIIRYEKEESVRNAQRTKLKKARKKLWYKKEIYRFINKTKAKVFLYTISDKEIVERLSESERQILKERKEKADDINWRGLSDEEWKRFWKDEYEEGIVDAMKAEMEQCVPRIENGVAFFPDIKGKCYHFRNGFRVTPNPPSNANRRIYFYGPCFFMGAYCRDDQTIPFYLQSKLNENHDMQCKVLNMGLFGPDYCYARMFTEELTKDDIVIIGYVDFLRLSEKNLSNLLLERNLTDVFLEIKPLTDYLADSPMHCNYIANQKIAESIYQDICAKEILNDSVNDTEGFKLPEKIQDYYINWDVHEYFIEYYGQYGLYREDDSLVKGAIIMNCNPFTKGHRYLIEQALDRVDKLYVFVVEEDKSYFAFQDRFRMVQRGVGDLSDVRVIPSGKYILSKDTFAQYFEKENVQVVENMDYDIRIFGEVVAKELGIKYRFVGEEPFDRVTKAYNETMKRILPEYSVAVVEIPRVMYDEANENVISATLVRKALEEKNWQMIETLCPESTVLYLKNMFDEEK
ncbi:MAG: adenylyltransferase/cytidyltransferase family protein [Lachnospiraceae bacterium]|nr:adenylyltransferase/cytidyltransferase family protein [Lachnospiraceae bacterium]